MFHIHHGYRIDYSILTTMGQCEQQHLSCMLRYDFQTNGSDELHQCRSKHKLLITIIIVIKCTATPLIVGVNEYCSQ